MLIQYMFTMRFCSAFLIYSLEFAHIPDGGFPINKIFVMWTPKFSLDKVRYGIHLFREANIHIR